MANDDRVILHSHAYNLNATRFAALVRRPPDARWWSTGHARPKPGTPWRRWLRGGRQALRLQFPEHLYGCSEAAAAATRHNHHPGRVSALVNGRLTATDLRQFEPRTAPLVALLVERLVPAKGVWIALEAAKRRLAHAICFVGYAAEYLRVLRT